MPGRETADRCEVRSLVIPSLQMSIEEYEARLDRARHPRLERAKIRAERLARELGRADAPPAATGGHDE